MLPRTLRRAMVYHPPTRRLLASSAVLLAKTRRPFLLADIGEGITECEIVKWLVMPDQVIDEFDPVVEVMSDKATVEITSPYKGRVTDLAGSVGDVLKVGGMLCQVEVDDGKPEIPEPSTPLFPLPSNPTANVPSPPAPPSRVSPAPSPSTSQPRGAVLATPATRRVARETFTNLDEVPGTGKDGRVTKSDVLAFVAGGGASHAITAEEASAPPSTPTPSPLPTSQGLPTKIALSPVRKAMFRAMTATLQIPHFSYSETIDVTNLERLRLKLNSSIPIQYRKSLTPADELALLRTASFAPSSQRAPEASRYDRITLLPLLLKALSTSLHFHPLFTCTLDSSDPSNLHLLCRPSHDISLALSSPSAAGGLYTPLLPAVDTSSPFHLASQIANLQTLALASSPPKFPEESRGTGTVTLSNVGVVGGRGTHPIIPPTGQLVIGAIGRTRVVPMYREDLVVEARRIAVEGGASEGLVLEPRLLMDVSFSADHRVVEGVELARFVETWKKIIEAPEQLVGLGH